MDAKPIPLHSPSPFGEDTQRYWDNRHELFTKWDEGIQCDRVGLFSVKPEAIALHTAKQLKGDLVLDAFCGVGGSAIGFARMGKRVVTCDLSAERLAMAKHNAILYGVADAIEFIHADIFEVMASRQFDAISLDPAWGGPDYYRKPEFHLSDFSPDGRQLLERALAITPNVALSLPKNFVLSELVSYADGFRIEKSSANGRVLFLTAYFGS